jgi:endonuclease I
MRQTVRWSLSGLPSTRRPGVRLAVRGAGLALAAFAFAALPAKAQKITEVVADHAGSPDTYEYIEIGASPALVVPPGVSDTILVNLSSYRIVELDGSVSGGGNPGKVLHVFQPGTTNSSGLWSTGYLTSTLERPAFTVLLVSGFSGAVGDDLDAGNDGVLDVTPWSAILDGVAFSDGTSAARTYTAPVLGPGFDGVATAPGGASRFPYYSDSESTADWKRNDFDGVGLPGLPGTLAAGEARNTPGTVNRVALADFYANVDASSQTALRTTIHAAIATHLRFPYTASTTDTWDILNLADEDPGDSGSILDIYRNATYGKITGGTGAYNREHSWPNSYGFNDNEAVSEYTDCHHLFASDVSHNSDRGNKPFGTCSSGCTERTTLLNHGFGGGSGTYPGNSNWFSSGSNVWETWNHRRGDIARAQLYMDVRYEGGTHPYTGASERNLVLTDNLSLIQTDAPYMGRLATLLAWHAADPPDDAERHRNDVVESFQGNRNPFVDHPEWVSCVFLGTGCETAADPPAVTTNAATGVTIAAATLNASVNPNGLATTASFQWGVTASYGQTTASESMGSGSSALPLSANLASLVPCTTYHFRATATSSGGTTDGGDLTFTTSCPAPTVTTGAVTSVTTTGATLFGTVNPSGLDTSASFEWGLTDSYGQTTGSQSMGSGSLAQPLAASLTNLTPCTDYHYRGTATSAGGTTTGSDASFQTTCAGGRLYTVAPCRVLDTRNDSAMTDGVPREVSFHGTCGIPTTARALAANVTATQPTLPGYVSVYPADAASTAASVVHFGVGRTRASATVIKLSDDGTGRARLEATVPTGGTTHVIVDVSGYFD